MDEIVHSFPWNCEDNKCPAEWHLCNIWTAEDGHTADWYADGDHEPIDHEDIPSEQDMEKAWGDYFRFVAATGTDPIQNFSVRKDIKRTTSWIVLMGNSIMGPCVRGARKVGRRGWLMPREFPKYLREYLNLGEKSPTLQDWKKWDPAVADITARAGTEDIIRVRKEDGQRIRVTIRIEHADPRSPACITKDTKSRAKRLISKDACFACGDPEDYDNPMRFDTAGVPVCGRGCKEKK